MLKNSSWPSLARQLIFSKMLALEAIYEHLVAWIEYAAVVIVDKHLEAN